MKTPAAILLIVLVGLGAFFAGSRTSAKQEAAGGPGAAVERKRVERPSPRRASGGREEAKARPGREKLSTERALQLTAKERMELLVKAATLGDPGRQADILCGLIPAMTKEQMAETTQVLLQAQYRGNGWSQDVWNTLWTTWGKVDPEGCLKMTKERGGLNTGEDYRFLMVGWLETSPQSALKWAKETEHNRQTAAAAAFALMSTTEGDPEKMEQSIAEVTGQPEVAKACLQDYFDLLVAKNGRDAVARTYDTMTPEMRQAAWPVVMYRLSYTGHEEAKAWLEKHAADPGRDYYSTYGMLYKMSQKEPKETLEWAAKLPRQAAGDVDADKQHPGTVSLSYWTRQDPYAAAAWVETQPADAPWTVWYRAKFKNPAAADPFASPP